MTTVHPSNASGMISLRDAVRIFKAEPDAASNSYDWYRKSAQRYGAVSIGSRKVVASKLGTKWGLSRDDFDAAIETHREDTANRKQRTLDYNAQILYGNDGETISTEFGGYRRRGSFHFVWSSYDVGTKRSNGSWVCSVCFRPASVSHNRDECSQTTDWKEYDRDGAVSTLSCEHCGKGKSLTRNS